MIYYDSYIDKLSLEQGKSEIYGLVEP